MKQSIQIEKEGCTLNDFRPCWYCFNWTEENGCKYRTGEV